MPDLKKLGYEAIGVFVVALLLALVLVSIHACSIAKNVQHVIIPRDQVEKIMQDNDIQPCPESMPNAVVAGSEMRGDGSIDLAIGCRP